MEILTLDGSLQPIGIVENYQSAIWTERYDKNGDFQITSNNPADLISRLPLESFVSLRESTVPMVVEAHKIEKQSGSAPLLTAVGRSFETVLERRASVNALPSASQRPAWTINAAKESDAAYLAMRTVLGDIARAQNGVNILPGLSPAVSLNDAIPQITLTLPADFSTATNKLFEIKAADLYSTVMELINANHHGLKAVRPGPGSTQAGIEIYNGADLTNTVVFNARFDQFDKSTYLLSYQGSANVGYVYGPTGSDAVLKNSGAEPSGLSRRVLIVDATGDSNVSSSAIRVSRGLVDLYQNNATALFDGEVAEQVAAGYNTSYFLGDILRLDGEYGLSEFARVTEYIRSSDATGQKAYPAFEAVI